MDIKKSGKIKSIIAGLLLGTLTVTTSINAYYTKKLYDMKNDAASQTQLKQAQDIKIALMGEFDSSYKKLIQRAVKNMNNNDYYDAFENLNDAWDFIMKLNELGMDVKVYRENFQKAQALYDELTKDADIHNIKS